MSSADVDLAPPGCELLVVGCGNLLRGDDGVGPILVRHLWERGVPEGARLVDGGTAGMDVAFQMRGAARVVIVDASATGAAPGTLYRVPGAELAELPPLQGLHTHSFRWDHAIAFARWALADACPDDITVFLIEAAAVEMGAELSEPVVAGMEQAIALIERDYLAPLRPRSTAEPTVEFTADGYLRLDAQLAGSRFPSSAAVALVRDGQLWLLPLQGPQSGGLLLKQRNVAGDRSTLIREVLADRIPVGVRAAYWDAKQGALRVPLPAPGGAVIVMDTPDVAGAEGVETFVFPEKGRWVVEIAVVFPDGVVRHRIDTHATQRRAELSAGLIKRAAERDLRGPLNG